MAFELKNFRSITGSMIATYNSVTTKVTDFNVGSKIRTLFEAFAIELELLYIRVWQGLLESVETAVFKAFDFPRLQPTKTSGLIRFTAPAPVGAPLFIPLGAQVRVPGTAKTYAVNESGKFIAIAGTFVDVRVEAVNTGSSFNTSAGTITELVTAIGGISAITNILAFRNGQDLESQLERRARFRKFIISLARSTIAGVEFGATTASLKDVNGVIIEAVAQAKVYEEFEVNPLAPAGVFTLYIYNGSGSTSGALVTETQKIIDGYIDVDSTIVPGYRAAGVLGVVVAATEVAVTITATLTLKPGVVLADVTPLAVANITSYFKELGIDDDFIREEAICRILDVPGIVDVVMTVPAANVVTAFNEVAVQGVVTLT